MWRDTAATIAVELVGGNCDGMQVNWPRGKAAIEYKPGEVYFIDGNGPLAYEASLLADASAQRTSHRLHLKVEFRRR